MSNTITIADLVITATAANVTAEQSKGIEAAISRVARRAEISATKRNRSKQRTIKEAVNALVGFGNTIHGARVAVSYRNIV